MLGEYGGAATDVRAEFIWMNPEVGSSGTFGGDDGLGGYMPLAVAANDNGTPLLAWVHANHMGVPALYTDATGAQIAMPTGYSAPGFPGQSRTPGLPGADLYYNRYRDYDPTTGRYIQADPIGLDGDVNPYLYANANPLGVIDPTGEFGVAGFGVGFALDIGIQMLIEGKSWKCVSIKQALISGAFGAVGAPAWARVGSGGLRQGMSRPNAAFPKGIEWVERSKFWPKRWGGTFSKYNVNPVWGTEHALVDTKRYRFLPPWWKKANKPNSMPSRFWHRLPNWFKGASIPSGFASAAQAQTSSENCGCN